MKKFTDLDYDTQKSIISSDKNLMEKLDRYIQDVEIDYVGDKLRCFERGSVEYNVWYWEPSYMKVLDANLFIDGVEKSGNDYGLSEKCERLLNQCKKLQDTNLLGYMVNKLCDLYFKEEIKAMLDWVVDCSMELDRGNTGEKSEDYLDGFIDNCMYDYLWDEEEEILYKPCSKVAA